MISHCYCGNMYFIISSHTSYFYQTSVTVSKFHNVYEYITASKLTSPFSRYVYISTWTSGFA
jgi:hypothetical protein